MLTIWEDNRPIRARDERKPDHFWADKEVVEDHLPNIGAHGFAVYMLLCYYSRSSTGRCWPSLETIGKKLNLSKPTVRKTLDALAMAGLIHIATVEAISKAGNPYIARYTFTIVAVKKHRESDEGVNVVDGGGKARLPQGVKHVYPNKTNTNNTDITREYTLSDVAKAPPTERTQKPAEIETVNDLKAESEDSNPPVPPAPPFPPPATAAKAKRERKPKADVPPPADGVLNAICVLCYGTQDAFKLNASVIRRCYNDLARCCAPVTLEQLREFYSWWKKNDWRGQKGQRPTTHQVESLWATAMSETKGALNGSSTERQLLGQREADNGGFKPTRIPTTKLP